MLRLALIVLLLTYWIMDLSFSFEQHKAMALDGDIQESILPSKDLELMFQYPLASKVLSEQAGWANPNRALGHLLMNQYLTKGVWFFQRWVSPIDSVYLAIAWVKILIQVMTCLFIALITIPLGLFSWLRLMLGIVCTNLLFQVNGYYNELAIIDASITYTFFYALPAIGLLSFVFVLWRRGKMVQEVWMNRLLLLLCWAICFFGIFCGPLNAPSIIIIISIWSAYRLKSFIQSTGKLLNKEFFSLRKDWLYWIYSGSLALLSIYSFYIGTFNSHLQIYFIPLWERYPLMLIGLSEIYSSNPYRLLGLLLLVNYVVLKIQPGSPNKSLLSCYTYLLLFACIYFLLLPMGGYKAYRAHIVRHDTILPVTLGIILLVVVTSLQVIYTIGSSWRVLYIAGTSMILAEFHTRDKWEDHNSCERALIARIEQTKDSKLILPDTCTVISWEIAEQPEQSAPSIKMLKVWRILPNDKQLTFVQRANAE